MLFVRLPRDGLRKSLPVTITFLLRVPGNGFSKIIIPFAREKIARKEEKMYFVRSPPIESIVVDRKNIFTFPVM